MASATAGTLDTPASAAQASPWGVHEEAPTMSENTVLETAPRRTSVGAIVLLVVGALIALAGFSLVAGGAAAASLAGRQGGAAFLTSSPALFAADSYAITTP